MKKRERIRLFFSARNPGYRGIVSSLSSIGINRFHFSVFRIYNIYSLDSFCALLFFLFFFLSLIYTRIYNIYIYLYAYRLGEIRSMCYLQVLLFLVTVATLGVGDALPWTIGAEDMQNTVRCSYFLIYVVYCRRLNEKDENFILQ